MPRDVRSKEGREWFAVVTGNQFTPSAGRNATDVIEHPKHSLAPGATKALPRRIIWLESDDVK
jgi:hypothetical protein